MESSDELWAQNFHEIIGSLPFDETFDVADFSPSPTRDSHPGPKPPSKGPKGSIGKPVRRRSRASKKAPTTLLKADANNFRALVQQFTGCHSATALLRAYKGPINLNFKQRNYYPEKPQPKREELGFHVREESDRSFFPFGAKDTGDRESRIDENPSRADADADALTYDPFDLDDMFWGSGDCSTEVPGAMNHEFW